MAAANTDKFMEVGSPGTATTLSSPGYTSGVSTSINVGSTTNWPTTTGIVFAIDESTTNSAGEEVRVDGTYNEFIGTVDSATSITNVDYVAGDAERSYSAGATTRVYIPVSATRENRLAQGILVDHSQSGGHEIATNYDPSNPTLETQKWVGVSSAVNEISVTNATTGNAPIVSATGGDTNIDIKLTPKGSGDVVLPASTSVKTDLVDEVTSANGVTIDGLNIKDGYVVGGATSGIRNASLGTEAGGLGAAWATWTPTLSGLFNNSKWTKTCTYKQVGKTIFFKLRLVANTTTPMDGAGEPTFTLPAAAADNSPVIGLVLSNGHIFDSGALAYAAYIEQVISSTTTARIRYFDSGAASGSFRAAITTTAPFTWTTSDEFYFQGFYEAA